MLLARLSVALSYVLAADQQHGRAYELAVRGVARARACGDGEILAHALTRYANSSSARGDLENAESAYAEAEKMPDLPLGLRLRLLSALSSVLRGRGDIVGAARVIAQVRKQHQDLGNRREEGVYAIWLAEEEYESGQTRHAITTARETLPTMHGSGRLLLLADLTGYLAAVDDLPGTFDVAREAILQRTTSNRDLVNSSIAIGHLALALALAGELFCAATLTGYSDAAERFGYPRTFIEEDTHVRITQLFRDRLTPEQLTSLTAEGATLTSETAVALAREAITRARAAHPREVEY